MFIRAKRSLGFLRPSPAPRFRRGYIASLLTMTGVGFVGEVGAFLRGLLVENKVRVVARCVARLGLMVGRAHPTLGMCYG